MTTIDSAIIKALVEHIGLNPDDVTTGATSTSNLIPVTWSLTKIESNTYALAFTLPEGYQIKRGTCLKVKGITYSEGWTTNTVLYCDFVSDDGTEFSFRNAKVNNVDFTLQNGLYVGNENCLLEYQIGAVPNNETTGLFNPTVEDAIEYTLHVFKAIDERLKALE